MRATPPGVNNALSRRSALFDVPAPATPIDMATMPVPDDARADEPSALRGRYLASQAGSCIECHTQHVMAPSRIDATKRPAVRWPPSLGDLLHASPARYPGPWDLVADGYVAENLRCFEAFARGALRLVPAIGEVVDVAARPGSLSLQAARTATRVHAVDFAEGTLSHLRSDQRQPRSPTWSRRRRWQALPFADASFEAFAGFSERVIARLVAALGAAPFEMKLSATLGVGTR